MTIKNIVFTDRQGQEKSFKLELDPDNFESDRNFEKALAKNRLYENEISEFFINVLDPGDVVIDVGANVGWFTILAATLVGPDGVVEAFEPAPANVEKLKRNIQLNGFQNIRVRPLAVGDELCEVEFYLNPYGNGGHALWDMQKDIPKNTPSAVMSVGKVRLDDFKLANKKPKLIKIDTEGHDFRVLKGATSLLLHCHPPFIVSELHQSGLHAFGETQNEFRGFMKAAGYDTFLLHKDLPFPLFLPLGTQIKTNYVQNLLFARAQELAKAFPSLAIDYGEPGL